MLQGFRRRLPAHQRAEGVNGSEEREWERERERDRVLETEDMFLAEARYDAHLRVMVHGGWWQS
jgi:hypothetical protein